MREGLRGMADKTDRDKTLTNRFEKLSKDLYAAKDDPAKREEIYNNIVETAKQTGAKLIGGAKTIFDELGKGALPISMKSIEGLFKDLKPEKTSPELEETKPKKGSPGTKINEDFIFGRNKAAESVSTGKTGGTGGGVTVNETIEVKPISGKIDINVTATGADSKIIEEILNKGSVTLKERIFEIVAEQSKVTPGRVK